MNTVAREPVATQTLRPSHGPRRVVFFHDSHGYGGMELYLLRLIDHLDPARYLPAVLIPSYTDSFRSSDRLFVQKIQDAGVPLLRPAHPGEVPGFSTVRDVAGITRVLRQHGADILHIHTCRSTGARKVTLAGRLAPVRGLLRTEHFPPAKLANSTTRFIVKPFDWLTDYIVTGSEGDRQAQIELLRRPPAKVYRSYNAVEPEKFDPNHDVRAAKVRLGLDPDIPVVGSVARLVKQKGLTFLLEAIAKVVESHGPVNLLLVGDGELRPRLEAQAERLGIANHVHFAGFQDDVLPYMQATDVAAIPSLCEVFSLAMLEFMALGKPVVTSDHYSFREAIVDGQHGLIVPRKDSDALAAALLKLLDDRQLSARLSQAGMERVRANFSFERLALDMMHLYDGLLAVRGKR